MNLYTKKEQAYMRAIGLNLDFDNLSDDDYAAIEEKVGDYLMYCGFDDDYEPNEDGRMCEGIIDKLPH